MNTNTISKYKETVIGFIPEDWELKTVKQLMDEHILEKPIDGNHGNIHPKSADFVSSGIPFIMASDLKGENVDTVNCNFISKKQADSLQKGFSVEGDVLLSHKATMGRTAIVKDISSDYIVLTPQVTYYRIKDAEKLNNYFLKYYFDFKNFQRLFKSWADSGSTRLYLGIMEQQKLPILIPPIEEQIKISEIILKIDRKIQINQKMNQTLEEIGQAIFKRWFVHFEFPNEEGKPYKSSGGEMVDSELGEIPQGWNIGKIQDLITHRKNSTNPSSNPDEIYYHYSIPAFDSGKTPSIDLGNSISSNKFIVNPNSILVSKLNPETPRIWYTRNVDHNSVCSTEFQVLVSKKDEYYSFIYYLLNSNYVKETMESMVTGTSKSHQRIRPSDLLNIEIAIPSEKLFLIFEDQIKDLNKLIQSNVVQNGSLAKIRDSLLPKLMSGKIRVPLEEK